MSNDKRMQGFTERQQNISSLFRGKIAVTLTLSTDTWVAIQGAS